MAASKFKRASLSRPLGYIAFLKMFCSRLHCKCKCDFTMIITSFVLLNEKSHLTVDLCNRDGVKYLISDMKNWYVVCTDLEYSDILYLQTKTEYISTTGFEHLTY